MENFKKITAGFLAVTLMAISIPFYPQRLRAQQPLPPPAVIFPPVPTPVSVPVYDMGLADYLYGFHLISSQWQFAQAMADAALVSKEQGLVPGVPYIPPTTPISSAGLSVLTSWDGIAMNVIKPLIRQFTDSIVQW